MQISILDRMIQALVQATVNHIECSTTCALHSPTFIRVLSQGKLHIDFYRLN